MKLIIGGLIISLLFCSCEKNINFKLKDAPPTIVVDAQIENGNFPTVILTRSFGFFDKISPELLAGAFVHNADVQISNGIKTHK